MQKKEVEIVKHSHMPQIEIFVVELTSRSPHGHDDLEIGLLLEGTLTLYLEHGSYFLNAGDLYLINRHQVHSFAKSTARNRVLAFQLSTGLYRKLNPACCNLLFADNVFSQEPLRSQLRQALLGCADMYFSDTPFSEVKCAALALDALYLLLQHARYDITSDKDSTSARNNAMRLSRIMDYIAVHYAEKLTLSEVAATEGITDYHLSHFVTKMLGVSFYEYLNQVRFEHALHLANETSLGLLDICMETGFSSTRYLNNCFKKNFGCTAKEYLSMAQKPPISKATLPTENIQLRYSHAQSRELLSGYFPAQPSQA